jgi:hypothetical protein
MPVLLTDGKLNPQPVRLFDPGIIDRRGRRNYGKFVHPANLRQFAYN